jgi:hypothetical protein
MSTGGTGRPRRLRRTTRYWACQVPSPPWLLPSDPPRRQRSLRLRPRRIYRLIVRQPMHYCITAYTDPSSQERAPLSPGAIVGISLAATATLCFLLALFGKRYRERKARRTLPITPSQASDDRSLAEPAGEKEPAAACQDQTPVLESGHRQTQA